eukprot:952121-Pleurochrysis_carterae.AAC.1
MCHVQRRHDPYVQALCPVRSGTHLEPNSRKSDADGTRCAAPSNPLFSHGRSRHRTPSLISSIVYTRSTR